MQTDTIHTSLTFNLFEVHLKHVQNIQTNRTNPYDFYFAFNNQFKILLIGNTFHLCLKLRLLNCVSQSQVFGKEMNTIDWHTTRDLLFKFDCCSGNTLAGKENSNLGLLKTEINQWAKTIWVWNEFRIWNSKLMRRYTSSMTSKVLSIYLVH